MEIQEVRSAYLGMETAEAAGAAAAVKETGFRDQKETVGGDRVTLSEEGKALSQERMQAKDAAQEDGEAGKSIEHGAPSDGAAAAAGDTVEDIQKKIKELQQQLQEEQQKLQELEAQEGEENEAQIEMARNKIAMLNAELLQYQAQLTEALKG